MLKYVRETPKPSENPGIKKHYDVVVIGGGLSGMCAAVSAARNGAKTCLVQDRSVYGGNCSSEVRMHIMGASCHWAKKNASETGLMMELLLENKLVNDTFNYSVWDGVMWGFIQAQEGLDNYMNTTMETVFSDGKNIKAVQCYQMSTEKRFIFDGDIYIDCTGHGTLGYFAGAEYAIGTEAKSIFDEKIGPDENNGETMGDSIMFFAQDVGYPVEFKKPAWAHTFDDSFFEHRYHGEVCTYHTPDSVVVFNPKENPIEDAEDKLIEKYDNCSGYWWIELGGDWKDIIGEAEDLRWELLKVVYGIWDHIKNGGDHGAENYDIVWFGTVAGVRESRRLIGDYILKETDISPETRTVPDDAVAYGGWPMDEHNPGGFYAKGEIPSMVYNFEGLYSIPYGCYCSKNIDNLMMAGRDISCSKAAMSSTRVMATCAIGGQAAGTAAAMASKVGLNPTEFGKKYIQDLRQQLLKDDCYIIGCQNKDPDDIARTAKVTASSEKSGFEAKRVISGVSRNTDNETHEWISDGISESGEKLTFEFDKTTIKQVRLTFDPNLDKEYCISLSTFVREAQDPGVPVELVKDYTVKAYNNGAEVASIDVTDNYQRLNIVDLPDVEADKVEIKFNATNGDENVKVFEVRIY
ncbi:MAG: FAD-dependent oxidoreductase [Coriobacteriia bacterium]|nr:FAD-dependent oxidoreductase [Coriobacteriia bacterium]